MVKAILALSLALICAGIGNLLLSKGMQMVGSFDTSQGAILFPYFVSTFKNPWVVVGVLLEIVYFGLWLWVLSLAELSWALPMHAIEYIFVAILALFLLGEEISLERWIGIFLITVGVVFMVKSWNKEEKTNEYPAG